MFARAYSCVSLGAPGASSSDRSVVVWDSDETISAGRSKSVGVRSSDMRALRLGELRRRIADDLRRDSAPLTTAANLPDIKRRAAESPESLTATEQAWLPWIGRATTLGLDLEQASAQAIAQGDRTATSIWTQSPNGDEGQAMMTSIARWRSTTCHFCANLRTELSPGSRSCFESRKVIHY